MQQVSTLGVNVSWLFIVDHSELETAGAVARESKTAGPDKITHPVNRSGFHSHKQILMGLNLSLAKLQVK